MIRVRTLVVTACLGLLASLLPAGAAAAANTVYPIGVDHHPPGNHNFEYVDYFPRAGVKVHTGDVLDFAWALTPDGLHTATLLKSGETLGQALAKYPLVTPDFDNGAGHLQVNPAILNPTFPPPGAGPAGCGDAAGPCLFDGSADLNSGALATDGATHFFVRIGAPAGTTVNFICLIHPGMAGSVQVVGNGSAASSLRSVQRLAARQGHEDTDGALEAEAGAEWAAVQPNPDGTRTVTMTAGTATAFVEVAEMLPKNLEIHAGDTVKWVTKTLKDPHTVTFPRGPAGDPLPAVCESAGGDLPFVPPAAGPPCGNPALFELHFVPQPQGATAITSPTTFGTSGVIGSPATPFPQSYSFSFPNSGTFLYQCKIHEHMVGTVRVESEEGD